MRLRKSCWSSLALLLALVVRPCPAMAQTVLDGDSNPPWDQTTWSTMGPYETHGQLFTAPAANPILNSFRLHLRHASGDAVLYRFYIMKWASGRATGPILFQSTDQLMPVSQTSLTPTPLFSGSLALQGNQEYVAILSKSAFFTGSPTEGALGFGYVPGQMGPPGSFVYINDDGDISKWTNQTWGGNGFIDFAFRATFGPTGVEAVPEGQALWLFVAAIAACGRARALRSLGRRKMRRFLRTGCRKKAG